MKSLRTELSEDENETLVLVFTGVQMTEIMLAHLVNQFTVLVGQTALVFLFMLLVFNIACHGSLALAVFITLLQGLCGMSYGKFQSHLNYCIFLFI